MSDADVVDIHASCTAKILELQTLLHEAWMEITLIPGPYQQRLADRLLKAAAFEGKQP